MRGGRSFAAAAAEKEKRKLCGLCVRGVLFFLSAKN
jgi:hypothetical protein